MLTRVYIDNFRCLVNFEFRPERKQLIFGPNGSGKSSFLDALLLVRQFAAGSETTSALASLVSQRTSWLNQSQQTFEIEASLDRVPYVYRLLIEPWEKRGDLPKPRVVLETVHLDRKPIFEFENGEVRLYNDRFEHKVTYPFDWHRSALATITARTENQKLTQFRLWLTHLLFFRINPFNMGPRADEEQPFPNVDLSNIAAWLRHLVLTFPKQNTEFIESLRASLEHFDFLQFMQAGENVRLLVAEFANSERTNAKFGFGQLSEGQRSLICLYAILHFALTKESTVIIDEPENFISLRELQPWLMAASDAVDEGPSQLFLISHHPELINQWAPEFGVQFRRDGLGPVRVEKFQGDPESCLSPSELVARGWENG